MPLLPRIGLWGSRSVGMASFSVGVALATPLLAVAQPVGPEVVLRDESTSGAAYSFVAAFGNGAAFVAWEDTRNEDSTDVDIYVQKLGPDGVVPWTANGVPACVFPQQQETPAVVADGTGGAVVAWRDQRALGGRQIYAQRVSSGGQLLWGAEGLRIGSSKSADQYSPSLHRSDGMILFSYGETRGGFSNTNWIVAQTIDETGQLLWGPDGVDVVEGVRTVHSVPDGSGGLVVFGRLRDEPDGFRFQRVLSDKSVAWPAPVDLAATVPFTALFNAVPDGTGGIILAYLESGVVNAAPLRVARVSGDGTLAWSGASTTLTSTNIIISQPPVLAPDGSGGAFVAWVSYRPRDVHVQHITSRGTHLWGAEGAVVPDLSGTERATSIISDGVGGVFLSFTTSSSLRAQRLDSSGAAQWQSNGSNGLNLMSGFESIIGLGTGGPIVIYDTGFGLAGRLIEATDPGVLSLAEIVFSRSANEVIVRLSGGVPGKTYDVLRTTALGVPPNATVWTVIGTIDQGTPWIDANPPAPMGFYIAAEPAR